MKTTYLKIIPLTIWLFALMITFNKVSGQRSDSTLPVLKIEGTGQSASFKVTASDLKTNTPVKITAPSGFSVTPATVPANAKNAKITVTLTGSRRPSEGLIVLRSGDTRSYIRVVGIPTSLPAKDISKSPIYKGGDDSKFSRSADDGFLPTDKGYTIEFKVKADNAAQEFAPYVVTGKGIGFKGYVDGEGTGVYKGDSKRSFSNPETSVTGGLGKFYNNDEQSHIYRYAVTPDNRAIFYRDGILIDTFRIVDLGNQPDFAIETGDPVENLLKNAGFEDEYDTKYDNKMAVGIEGWNIVIGDRYNSEQYIVNQELDNNQDFNNHVLQMQRYKWSDGWSAAEIDQIVDVAPNEVYSLSALIRGGIKKKEGTLLGKMKIMEVQDRELGTSTDVTSDGWETYSLDYTTSADCKQIRVLFYLERDKWGADITPMEIDNVKLTGKQRLYAPKIGFENEGTEVEYFTYDLTGAYAPVINPKISISLKN